MQITTLTPKDINKAQALFWSKQQSLFNERMANDVIRAAAFEALKAQMLRAVPIFYQAPLEQLLEDAARNELRFSRGRARKGGIARKADSLQLLIEDIVRRHPDISESQLLEKLCVCQTTHHVVQDIDDGTIFFTIPSGHIKEALVSGLKHRLSRAKKKVRSR